MRKRKSKYSRRKSFQKKQKRWSANTGLGYRAATGNRKKIQFNTGKIYVVGAVGAVVFILYLVMYAGFFTIENIIVENPLNVTENEVKEGIEEDMTKNNALFFPNKNILFFSESQAEEKIRQKNPLIKDVKFKKEFPNILRVSLVENEIALIADNNGASYFVAADGLIVKKAEIQDIEERKYPFVTMSLDRELQIGSDEISVKNVRFIQKLNEQIIANASVEAESFSMPTSHASEVHMQVKESYKVFFSTEQTVESQIQNLETVLEKEIQGKQIEYIDLRVGNWVYYK